MSPGYQKTKRKTDKKFTVKADIYAFGVIVYKLFVHETDDIDDEMISKENNAELKQIILSRIQKLFQTPKNEVKLGITDDICDILKKCLDNDPLLRPDCEELLKKSIFQQDYCTKHGKDLIYYCVECGKSVCELEASDDELCTNHSFCVKKLVDIKRGIEKVSKNKLDMIESTLLEEISKKRSHLHSEDDLKKLEKYLQQVREIGKTDLFSGSAIEPDQKSVLRILEHEKCVKNLVNEIQKKIFQQKIEDCKKILFPSVIRIVLIGLGPSARWSAAAQSLKSKDYDLQIVARCFSHSLDEYPDLESNPNFESEVKNIDLDAVDVFFVESFNSFPPWFGDHLESVFQNGKSLIFSGYCLSALDSGVEGAIKEELPCDKGEWLYDDSKSELVPSPKGSEHPILKGFNSKTLEASCGTGRFAISMRATRPEEEIGVIAKWNDEKHTPMIITKEYKSNGERANWGRIVVLNFVTDNLKFGIPDVVLQNSIIWAAKSPQLDLQKLLQSLSDS